jgi:hypothetical protein
MIASQIHTPVPVPDAPMRPPLNAADWLSLAGTPTFAIWAVLTAVVGESPLTNMVTMYLLMGVIHSAYWVKLIFRRRRGIGRS